MKQVGGILEPQTHGDGALAPSSAATGRAPRRRCPPRSRVQSLRRAFDLLEVLAGHGAAGLPLKAVSLSVGLHPSTAHHLLTSLLVCGYVEQEPETGFYRLGAAVLTLAHQFLNHCDLAQLAAPFLRRLHAELDEWVLLSVLQGGREHAILQLQSSRPLVINRRQSGGGALHCTSPGKVLLSGLGAAEMEALLAAQGLPRHTPHTITGMAQLRREVAQVRVLGYAIAREEHYEGVIGVAAPVQDATGRVVAAVGMPFPTFRATPAREEAITRAVRRTAAEISLRLGYQPAAEVLQQLAHADDTAGGSRAGTTATTAAG